MSELETVLGPLPHPPPPSPCTHTHSVELEAFKQKALANAAKKGGGNEGKSI